MANFEAFHEKITPSINLLFLKSGILVMGKLQFLNNQCIKRVVVCTQIWVGTFYWNFLTFSVFGVQCLQQFWGGKWRKNLFLLYTWKTDFHEGMWLVTNNLTMSMYVPIIMASYLFKILVIIPVQFHVKWTPN